MADDYIKVTFTNSSGFSQGFKILTNLTVDMSIFKGIETTDISLVTTTNRKLLPTSGLKEDPTLVIELTDDGTNKAFNIDNVGNETSANIISTKEQLNFILDNLMRPELSAEYEIRVDWLDKLFTGILTVRGNISGDKFFNNITLTASLKVGTNIFNI